MKREHNWNKEDAIITFYWHKFGTKGLIVDNEKDLAENVIGSSLASMKMQEQNIIHLLDNEQGLDHYSIHQEQVVEEYFNTPQSDLIKIVNAIIDTRDLIANSAEFKITQKQKIEKKASLAKETAREAELAEIFRKMGKDPSKMKKIEKK
jgi:hypothetical protein